MRTVIRCEMIKGCPGEVSYIDEKGFIYCTSHGLQRQTYYRCRKIKAGELKRVKSNIPLPQY